MKSILKYIDGPTFILVDETGKTWSIKSGDILITKENLHLEFTEVIQNKDELYAIYKVTAAPGIYDTRHRSSSNWIEMKGRA